MTRTPRRPTATTTLRPRGDEEARPRRDLPSHLLARGSVFRRRHRLHGPLALYGGRIDPGQGLRGADRVLQQLRQGGRRRDAGAHGREADGAAGGPFIRFAGLLSDSERVQALEAATVVVCPSPYESLSLLALEAMSVGTPVLANARSAVLVEHCVRSNGGLWYADRDEFVECLKLLVGDAAAARGARPQRPRLRAAELSLGRRARQVRADLREGQERALIYFSSSASAGVSGSTTPVPAGAASPRARRAPPSPLAWRFRRGRMS